MIHKYRLFDENIVLDIESGSVFVFDREAFDIIPRYENGERGIFPEIDELIADGLLFTPEQSVGVSADRRLKALCLLVTNDCNLNCGYCFNEFSERGYMRKETAFAAIDMVVRECVSRRNIEIDFFGGEPLLNFDCVRETVVYAKTAYPDKQFRFTLTTNGVLLDDENGAFLNEHMENVVLSMDGRRDVNDRIRGGGVYDIILPKYLEFAKKRRELKKDLFVRATYTKYNKDFSNDVKHLHELGFRDISAEPVFGDFDYALIESDLPELFGEYETLLIDILEKKYSFFHFNIDLSGGPCSTKRQIGCGAGCEYLAVAPNGDLYPCHRMENFCLGNVFSKDRDDKIRQYLLNEKDLCSKCWAKYYCGGGCMASSYHTNGTLTEPYSLGCELLKKRVECGIFLNVKKNT